MLHPAELEIPNCWWSFRQYPWGLQRAHFPRLSPNTHPLLHLSFVELLMRTWRN